MAPERSERPSEFGPSLGSQVLSTEPLTAFGAHVVRWEPWHRLSAAEPFRAPAPGRSAAPGEATQRAAFPEWNREGEGWRHGVAWLDGRDISRTWGKKTGDGIEIYRLFAFG